MANVQNTVINRVAPAAAGYLAGELLDKQLTLFTKQPTLSNGLKVAGGIALSVMADGFIADMGIGLAANGVVDFARPMLEKAGIVGTGISLLNPGDRGYYVAGQLQNNNISEPIKMQ